ncbi:MAG: hypothetical protein ABI318_14045 [Chthoniobacteraceae bacterium]
MPFQILPLAAGLGRSAPEILFYGIGIVLLVAAAFLSPHRGMKWFRAIERVLARIARHRAFAVAFAGIAAFLLVAAMTAIIGVPLPKVDDEFSYLLAADTFTHGRLANPPHSMWEHFETFHVLQQPTYASKYPPGQGLLLALGKVIAHPIVGVWLCAALACAAITWMLMAWLPPRWALLGGLLAAVHPEVLLWSQRYWGGCLALAGGALGIGGFRRVMDAPRVRDALLMASGVAVLMYTRPYEGAVLTMLLGTVLLVSAIRKKITLRDLAVRVVLPSAALLCVAAAWLGFYNWRVTGNALRMPYQIHVAQYMAAPIFIWQKEPSRPVYHHADMHDFHLGWEYRGYAKQRGAAGLATGLIERTWRLIRGEMRLWFLSISLLALPWALRRDGWMRFALIFTLVFFAALLLVNWTFFHYAAPVFGLFFFSAVQCMRHLRTWRWRGKPAGLFLARGSVILCALSVLATGRDVAAQFRDGWWDQRRQIIDQLHRDGGKHLVVIRYGPNVANTPTFGYRDWTRNDADIDGQEIIWAREMDAEHNRKLLDYYKDRRAWLLDVDISGTKLLPYPR